MSKNKKKIVIPSEEEVAAYGQEDAGDATEASSSDAGTNAEDAAGEQPVATMGEAQEWKDKYLRARAELANYQRRAEKDRSDALKYANAGLIKSLLPVIDDLERVLQHENATGEGKEGAEAMLNGVRLTLDNLMKALQQFEVKVIASEGQEFDPACHEAMMEQPSDAHPHRTVLQELSKGYRLHDRVLRPSKVIVSKASEPPSVEEAKEPNETPDA